MNIVIKRTNSLALMSYYTGGNAFIRTSEGMYFLIYRSDNEGILLNDNFKFICNIEFLTRYADMVSQIKRRVKEVIGKDILIYSAEEIDSNNFKIFY